MSNTKCPQGKILRDGYYRSSYYRKSYTRQDGTKVPESIVLEHYVPPTCINDIGKPGKGPKTLPPLDDYLHLRDYGYSVYDSDTNRHKSLIRASRDNDSLMVLQRLNFIRNINPDSKRKDIYSKDVRFMSQYHQYIKNRQKGGNIDYNIHYNVHSNYVKETRCDNGECSEIINVYEKHTQGEHSVIYRTANPEDATGLLSLNVTGNKDVEHISEWISENYGNIILIESDKNIKGYFFYCPEDKIARIEQFIVVKGFRTALFVFMEKFLSRMGHQIILVKIMSNQKQTIETQKFWYSMGLKMESQTDNGDILLEKHL